MATSKHFQCQVVNFVRLYQYRWCPSPHYNNLELIRCKGGRAATGDSTAAAHICRLSHSSMSQPPSPLPPPPQQLPPPASPSRPPPFQSGWIKWAVGSILSLVLSFGFPRWATLLRIVGEAEVAMEEVEHAAEVIEKVATVADKVSEDIADQLPDQSKFKKAALIVEHVSNEAAKDARFTEEFIHKVKHDIGDVDN